VGLTASAQAQLGEIEGVYATNEDGCTDAATKITITEASVTGTEFRCQLGDYVPIGTGLVGMNSVCTYRDGQSRSGVLVLDVGNGPNILISVPGQNELWRADEWVTLYPCS
jgi:hypothetical protein